MQRGSQDSTHPGASSLSAPIVRSDRGRLRVAYLQKAPSGHIVACLQALIDSNEIELFLNLPRRSVNAPFEEVAPRGAAVVRPDVGLGEDAGLLAAVREFNPDILVIVGWEVPAFRKCARSLRGQCLRVVCLDNQWNRTPRQILGIAARRFYLHPYFDAAFVAGHRQRVLLRKLGYRDGQIFDGFYSCDVRRFVPPHDSIVTVPPPRSFLFVGRLVADKGIDDLVAAYRKYQGMVADPWPLVVAGEGPLFAKLEAEHGVALRGFIQPAGLPPIFAESSFLLVPSRYEPWGVVVHEAVTAGLGVIATSAVGAADLFVQPGVNGVVFGVGDAEALSDALQWAHQLSDAERETVQRSSQILATLRSPEGWVTAIRAMAELRQSLPELAANDS